MTKVYNLSNKGVSKHLVRLALLLVTGVVMAGLVIWLGGSRARGGGINAVLLAVDVVAVNLICQLTGTLDGKDNRGKLSLIILGASAGLAAIIWLLLTVIGKHAMAAGLLFFTNIALVAGLLYVTWGMIKNIWHMLSDDLDKNGNIMSFPGNYVLNQVHCDDSLTSPMGRVLIKGSTVMFVYVNQLKGHVLVKPNGEISIRQEKVLRDKSTKESKVSISELLEIAESGSKRVMKIVEKECAARNVPVPAMKYGYAVFMPNFKRTNYVVDEGAFLRYPFMERVGSYKSYLDTADKTDVFRGRACFTLGELDWMASALCGEHSSEEAARANGALTAECIAKACDLVPKEK